MTFHTIMTNLKPGEFAIWWAPPVAAGVMALCGFGLAALFFARELPKKRNMLPLTGIHNAAYLPLPLGALLCPDQFDLFALYVFLFLMGQTPIIWSIGKYMTTAAAGIRFKWTDALNPPMISALLALALVFSGLRDALILPDGLPSNSIIDSAFDVLMAAVSLLGEATIPVALFILGGVLGNIRFRLKSIRWDALKVILVKFFLIPLFAFITVFMTGLHQSHPLLATFFIIQSASPPGIVIILQVSRYGGDEQKLGSMLLVTYLACLLAMPFWLAVWGWLAR
jgi:predicted permease